LRKKAHYTADLLKRVAAKKHKRTADIIEGISELSHWERDTVYGQACHFVTLLKHVSNVFLR